jgi:SAM-dependent methyltransferase
VDQAKAIRELSSDVKRAHKWIHFRELADSWDLWHDLFHRRVPSGGTRAAVDRTDLETARRLIAGLSRSASFLDLGCGTGRLLRLVAPHCRLAHGADVSPKALHYAARECRGLANARFHRVTSWKLGLPVSSMDLVFSRQMFQYLDIESAVAYFKEVRRVLTPQGRFSFDLPNFHHESNLRRMLAPERTNWPGPHRLRPWTSEMARALLPRCGFRIEKLTSGPFLFVDASRK